MKEGGREGGKNDVRDDHTGEGEGACVEREGGSEGGRERG
jgi:hypothetical protein